MAAANSTPIQLYYSNTPGSIPANTNLIIGELAINVPDGIIFYKDSSNNTNVIARTAAAEGRFPNVTFLSDGTTQFTAAAPWAITNTIWQQANTSTQNISVIQGVNLTQNSTIATVYSVANTGLGEATSSFLQANGAFHAANLATANALSASTYANAAFDVANTATTDVAIIKGVNNKQNTDITYVTSLSQQVYDFANTLAGGSAFDDVTSKTANAAFIKANSAYALSINAVANGAITTVAGNLNVPGQANVIQRLAVGQGAYQVLPNLIAQFTGSSDYYSQINQQNLSGKGTGDVVVTSDNGTDLVNYIDMGMAGSVYDNTTPNAFGMVNPNDGYVMLVGDAGSSVGGNLYVGTSGSGAYADISIIQGTEYTETARFINGQGLKVKTGTAATDTTSGALVVTGGAGVSGSLYAGAVYDGTTRLKTYTDTANTYLQGTKVSKSGDTINGHLSIVSATDTALSVTGNVVISKDLTINGNLIIGGNTTSIAANNLVIDDSILYIANNNQGNSSDIGVLGHFISGKYQHTGLVRDHTDSKWKLFSNVSAEPTSTIDFSDAVYDTLKLGTIESGNAIVNGVDVVPFLLAASGTANAAFLKANTGGVRTITVTNRLSSNTNALDVKLDLATTTVVAGTYSYPQLTVDSYGRLTDINTQTPVTSFNTRTGTVTLEAGDVSGALGYTPVNSASYNTDVGLQAGIDTRQNTNITVVGSYANAAFGQANIALLQANDAFTTANTGIANAQGASIYANGAFAAANTAIADAQGASIYANGAFTQANVAFNNANAASYYANSAFDTANTSFIRANTAVSDANGASNYANAAFALANTVSVYANTSHSTLANGSYTVLLNTQGVLNLPLTASNTSQLFAPIDYDLLLGTSSKYWQFKGDGSGIIFPDNTKQTTAYPVTSYSTANSAGIYANAAFHKANSALANTSNAIFGGNLYIAGDVDVVSVVFNDGTRQTTSSNAASSYANSAFDTANVAGLYANTGINIAQGAFDAANNAYTAGGVVAGGYANSAFGVANLAYDGMVAAGSYANSAFGVANLAYDGMVAAGSYANSAFGLVNASFTAANSAGSYANSAYNKANSAWVLAQNAYDYANTLVMSGGSVDSYARSIAQNAYDAANNAFNVGQGAFDTANNNTTDIGVLYGIDYYQNTYIQLIETKLLATSIYANAAFDAANNAYTAGGVVAGSYANAAFDVANAASSYANSAFSKANTNSDSITVVGTYANTAITESAHSLDIAQRAWNQANTSATFSYTVSSTPPTSPGPSDLWFDSTTDIMYQYITTDGTNYYWIDIDSPTVSAGNTIISYTYTGYGRAVAHAMIFGGF